MRLSLAARQYMLLVGSAFRIVCGVCCCLLVATAFLHSKPPWFLLCWFRLSTTKFTIKVCWASAHLHHFNTFCVLSDDESSTTSWQKPPAQTDSMMTWYCHDRREKAIPVKHPDQKGLPLGNMLHHHVTVTESLQDPPSTQHPYQSPHILCLDPQNC